MEITVQLLRIHCLSFGHLLHESSNQRIIDLPEIGQQDISNALLGRASRQRIGRIRQGPERRVRWLAPLGGQSGCDIHAVFLL